jgi:hypothetical protein
MKLLKNFIDHLEIFSYLKQLNIPKPNSNAGYDPNILILGFWLSIFTGGNRFSHTDWLRYDATLQSIFELEKLPSSSTYNRFFYKFDIEKNSEVFPMLQQWFLDQFKVGKITLDLDSTVITRYGDQEGSVVGYNPKKRGRKSHHPLMAFIDQTKMVANAWLRAGNTADTISQLPDLQLDAYSNSHKPYDNNQTLQSAYLPARNYSSNSNNQNPVLETT